MSNLAVYAITPTGSVPLHGMAPVGKVAFSTVFGSAGGCGLDQLTFSMTLPRGFSNALLVQGTILELRYGPTALGRASLTTIDFETGAVTATGLFKRGGDFTAFADLTTYAGTLNPKTGIQNAITLGLEWQVDAATLAALDVTLSTTGTSANLDATTWYTISDLLDAYCGQQGANVFWGIDPTGFLRIYHTPTAPSFMLSPSVPAMDSTTTDYVTDLVCRYSDITKPTGDGSTFYDSAVLATVPVRVGSSRKFGNEDITSHGPLTAAQAQDIADQTLAAKSPTLTYNGGVDIVAGDVRTLAGGAPVPLWRVVAEAGLGVSVRHHGWRNMQGALMPGFAQEWVIGKASYSDGGAVSLSPTADAAKTLGQTLSSTAKQVAEVGKQADQAGRGVVMVNTFAQQLSDTLTQAQQDIDAAVTQADKDRQASANGSAANYAANGSFEYVDADGSLVGWVTTAGITVDATKAHTGTQCVKTLGNGELQGQAVPVLQGQTWQLDWWYMAGVTDQLTGGLRLQSSSDGGTTWVDAATSTIHAATANAWKYQAVSYLVAAGVTHVRSRLAFGFTPGTGRTVWGDDVSLTNVTALVAAKAAADAAQNTANGAVTQAQAAITAANGINVNYWGVAPPTSATPGLPGDNWWVQGSDGHGSTGIIAQYQCTAGTRTNTGNAWTLVPLTYLAIASIDIGKAVIGYLDVANRIQAGSITTSKMVIADLTNLVADPGFADGLNSWTTNYPAGVTLDAGAGVANLTKAGTTGEVQLHLRPFPVKAGLTYRLTYDTWLVSSPDASLGAAGVWSNMAGWTTSPISTLSTDPANPTHVSATLTAPSDGLLTPYFYLNGDAAQETKIAVTKPNVRVMADAELIVDGSVLAEHLAATMDVTAKEFIGGTYTGNFYRTGSTGRRMEVGHNVSGGIDPSNIALYNGISGESPGVIGPWNVGGGVTGAPALAVTSPIQSTWSHSAEIDLMAGSGATTIGKTAIPSGNTEPQAVVFGNLNVNGDVIATGNLTGSHNYAIVNFGANVGWLGDPYSEPYYYVQMGRVWLHGHYITTAALSAGAAVLSIIGSTAIPNRRFTLTSMTGSGAQRLQVDSTGIISFPTHALGSGEFFSLDGLSYPAHM